MSRAIEDLKHEHDAILFALGILASMDRRMAAETTVDVGDVTDFVGFLREFADTCHHGKEEGFLFPALQEAGGAELDELVEVLRDEHEQGRGWLRELEAAVRPTPDVAAFSVAASGYADLLAAHIRKEDEVLFPMAERTLTADRLHALFEAFEQHESQVIGEGRHEQLHGLLRRLKAKYPD